MWSPGPNVRCIEEKNSINYKLSKLKDDLTQEEAKIAFAQFCYANPSFAAKLLTGVTLYEIQDIIIRIVYQKDYSMFVFCRGGSKSFTSAILICLYAIFHPGTKIVVTAKNARQTRAIFNQIEKFTLTKDGKFLKDCLISKKGNMFHRNTDGWNIQFVGGSSAVFLPLGSGDQIRGQRANLLIVDEFLLMDEGIFNNVILPFLSSLNEGPERQKLDYAENLLVEHGLLDESEKTPEERNKLVIMSSASYQFEYLYELYQKYKEIIFSKKKDENGHVSHAVLKVGYEAIPKGLLDDKAIKNFKKQMSSQQFRREIGSEFLDDSGGFFSAKKMAEATVPVGMMPALRIVGDPDKKYILSVDANYDSAETSDHFAMSIIELNEENETGSLVHNYAVAKSDLKYRGYYTDYLLNNFNIVFICVDKAGTKKFFDDMESMKLLQKRVRDCGVDFTNTKSIRDTMRFYDSGSGRILYLQKFNETGWIRDSNEHLAFCIENKKILFASKIDDTLRDKYMKLKIPIHQLEFTDDMASVNGRPDEYKLSEFIENQNYLVDLVKDECILIQIKEGRSGNCQFDLPSNLSKEKGPNKVRKDSYTSLLLGVWGMKLYYDLMREMRTKKKVLYLPGWAV